MVRVVRTVSTGFVVLWGVAVIYVGVKHFKLTRPPEVTSTGSSNDEGNEGRNRAAVEGRLLNRQQRQSGSYYKPNDPIRHGDAEATVLTEQEARDHRQRFSHDQNYEISKRKFRSDVNEFWSFLLSQLKDLEQESSGGDTRMRTIRLRSLQKDVTDYYRTILDDMESMSAADGSDEWRRGQLENLSKVVQRRLHRLQNPENCDRAPLLVCSLNKGCGYACQIHHLIYCLIVAYASRRTLILDSTGWRYSAKGWEAFFRPVSTCSTPESADFLRAWSGDSDNETVVELPIIENLQPRPSYLPQAVPADLAKVLVQLHGSPFVWWVGQLLKYLLRPQPSIENDVEETERELGFQRPIVGVHIRRTDKVGTEAKAYEVDEYMRHVDDYYDQLERRVTVVKRRIYLASDDPAVFNETISRYPEYEVIGNISFSRLASLSLRYTEESLRSVIMDIHFLSQSDFIVCTFSSHVCRLAYELMQTRNSDASGQFRSLDDIYYFGGQNNHTQRSIATHESRSPDEIDLSTGDLVNIAGNHWNGFSVGTNLRTWRTGLYPSYKTAEHLDSVEFPR